MSKSKNKVNNMANDSPFLVQAIYAFKGKNNDELCFKKGDIITVTQVEEGGWWEGTLDEKTGWFPSNYVKESKGQEPASSPVGKTSPVKLPPEAVAQQKVYRNLVLKDLIDSEKAHVAELQGLMKNFLHPLEKSEVLTVDEYRQLVGNIEEVVELHQQLLAALEDYHQRTSSEQRVGRLFLQSASRVKHAHQLYCSTHPRAVCMLEKYKDELNGFMESQGAHTPGILVLTTGLSKPFRRLEKYAGMLQELERHVEENHPDRGDTQRSVSVYKDIASSCSATRRQKELELEVLTGGVRGWEGEDLATLGEIVHMGSVAVGADHRDRYFVLFPSTLLILSVSQRMSAFIYEGKLPLSGITANKLEDSDMYKNAFEIMGPMIERIVAVCQTREDQQRWVDMVKQQIRALKKSSIVPSKPQPLPPPHVSHLPPYQDLTMYIADLLDRKIITRQLLKQLLYKPLREDVNVLGVEIRRKHKVECVIFPTKVSMNKFTTTHMWVKESIVELQTDSDSASAGESVRTGSDSTSTGGSAPCSLTGRTAWKFNLKRQEAIECNSDEDCDKRESHRSNPFGYIRYFDPKDHTSGASLEAFIDGKGESGEVGVEVGVQCSEVDFEATSEASENSVSEAAEISGVDNSTAEVVQGACMENSVVEVSKGCCKSVLFIDPSYSTESEESRCENAAKSSTYRAREDLLNLGTSSEDDGTGALPKLNTDQAPGEQHVTRRSLPVSILQRSFQPHPSPLVFPQNQSSSEKDIYTSCHRVHVDPNPLSQSMPMLPHSYSSESIPTTHSSVLDLPINIMPVPSDVLSTLLQDLSRESSQEGAVLDIFCHQESVSSEKSVESVIPKPGTPHSSSSTNDVTRNSDGERAVATFGSQYMIYPIDINSSTQSLPTLAKSNCATHSTRSSASDTCHTRKDSPSDESHTYHYVRIVKNVKPSYKYCHCEIPSQRSSDSGLADVSHYSCNCPLTSKTTSIRREGGVEFANSEPWAIDRPRTPSPLSFTISSQSSPADLSQTAANVTNDDVDKGSGDIRCLCDSAFGPTPRTSTQPSLTSEHLQVGSAESVALPSVTSSCLDISPHVISHSRDNSDDFQNVSDYSGTYRSGMYAHWWLKAKIPASVLGIERTADSRRVSRCGSKNTPLDSSGSAVKIVPETGKKSALTAPMSPRLSQSASPASSLKSPSHPHSKTGWSMSCLRPSPPIRPCLALGRDDNNRKSGRPTRKRAEERSFEDDAQILRVIEAYCTSAKTRHTVNSVDLGHLTRGNVLHDDYPKPGSVDFNAKQKMRASTWCCGNFVVRTIRKTHFD